MHEDQENIDVSSRENGDNDHRQNGHNNDATSSFPLRDLEPQQSARTLGDLISPKTQRTFGVQEFENGHRVATSHVDGTPGQLRFLSRYIPCVNPWCNDPECGNVGRYRASWSNKEGRERPPGFGLHIARSLQEAYKNCPSARTSIYLADNEIDCMVMHEAGKPTISTFGEPQGHERLAKALSDLGVGQVRIVFRKDASGRSEAVKMANAFREHNIRPIVHSIPGKRGHTICDEWELQNFDRDKFRRWVDDLPVVDEDTLQEWALDPNEGLPPEESDGKVPYTLSTVEQLRDEPPPQFLVQGIIPLNSQAMLSGRHSSGKSALALDLGLCIASGRPWHNHDVVQGPVLYIAAEGGGGIPKRIQVWQQEHGAENIPNFYLLRETVPLHERLAQSRLMSAFRKLNTGFALIIVDTLVLCSGGLDENMARDMSNFMNSLQLMSRATSASILLIHHDNKAGEYRGSTALAAGVDTHLAVTTGDNAATVRLETLKQKDHQSANPLVFRRQTVEVLDRDGTALTYRNGAAITSFIYRADANKESLLSPAERLVLQKLVDITTSQEGAGTGVVAHEGAGSTDQNAALLFDTDSVQSGATYRGATASEWEKACCDSRRISEATFVRAKRRLINPLKAVECDFPGQRGGRYVVLPEWRRLLAEDSNGSYLTDSSNESESPNTVD